MCGEAEFGKCDCCGKETIVSRKYYHYNIKCDCCGGKTHFEIVRYCTNCSPKPKSTIRVVLRDLMPIEGC
ncbi:MAG: hypothetical protein M0Q13_02555 [Methanothrix sp.]|jgi:hypothetical protein|nr:hypothetical protein [Methanothrix sp.]